MSSGFQPCFCAMRMTANIALVFSEGVTRPRRNFSRAAIAAVSFSSFAFFFALTPFQSVAATPMPSF